jgi:protein-tyrosine kinase
MREVDQALARAYAQRGATDHSVVPPAPHLPTRLGEPPSTREDSPRYPEPDGGRTEPVEPVLLHWPATIRTLEREFGDRFSHLADALIEARDRQRLKVLLFTSCHRAEGRTTLILTLARALARRPGKTLLVDADLTGPMLARQLGLRPKVGLDDVIDDGLALSDALVEARDDHLTILPLRAPVSHPRDFLASPAWSCVLARLRREYDLVLLDGSPLFAGLSAAVLHRSVDAAILVHSRALTGDRALQRAREVLDAGGVPLLGMAETFV